MMLDQFFIEFENELRSIKYCEPLLLGLTLYAIVGIFSLYAFAEFRRYFIYRQFVDEIRDLLEGISNIIFLLTHIAIFVYICQL